MKKFISATVIAGMLLSGCAGGGGIERPAPVDQIGGDYILVWGFQLAARDGLREVSAPQLTVADIADLRSLQAQCRAQTDPQLPSAAAQIGRASLQAGVAGAAGTGLGAIAAFTGVGFAGYAAYGGIASAVQGANNAADRYNLAVRYVRYACMQYAVSYVQRQGRLPGVGVLPWAGSFRARALTYQGVPVQPLAQQVQMGSADDSTALPPPL